MKLKIQKQHSLKGLLLLALVANMSWRPAMRSLNMSSETASGTPTAPAPAAPVTPQPPKPDAVTAGNPGPKPDAAAKTETPVPAPAPAAETLSETPEKPARVDTPKICGQRFYITYSEDTVAVDKGSEKRTIIRVKPLNGVISGFKPISYASNGGLDVNYDNAEIKRDNDERIRGLIRARLGRCPEDVPVVSTPERPEPSVSKEEKEALKIAVKECRKNSRGDSLSESERVHCQIRRLSDVDADTSNRGGQARAIAQIEKLVKGEIRTSIKNRLMSKDESKVDEGEALLSETIDAVKDLAIDLNLDPERTARMTMGLESLRAGGEAYRKANVKEDEVRQTRADLRDQLTLAMQDLRMNPNDAYAQQRLLQVQRDMMTTERRLQGEVQMEITGGPYSALVASMRMGAISSTEFSQFTQPYQLLQRDMLSLLDQRSLLAGDLGGSQFNPSLGALGSQTSQALPADFASYRTGLNNNFQRNYGVNVPQQPSPLQLNSTPSWTVNNASVFNNGLYGTPTVTRGLRIQ